MKSQMRKNMEAMMEKKWRRHQRKNWRSHQRKKLSRVRFNQLLACKANSLPVGGKGMRGVSPRMITGIRNCEKGGVTVLMHAKDLLTTEEVVEAAAANDGNGKEVSEGGDRESSREERGIV
jgi:hypothetical protein